MLALFSVISVFNTLVMFHLSESKSQEKKSDSFHTAKHMCFTFHLILQNLKCRAYEVLFLCLILVVGGFMMFDASARFLSFITFEVLLIKLL